MRSLVGLSLALVLLATKAGARSDFPNHTEVLVTIMADENWVGKQGMPLTVLQDVMTNSISSNARFSNGILESTFTSLPPGNITGEYDPGKTR